MTSWPPSALVLAAGLGTRLRPLSCVRAKPAMPVAGVPLITRILGTLAAADIRDVAINLHHRPETITAVVGDGADLDLRVRYSWEHPVLGSAGGPRHALPLLTTDPFLLINGDTLPTVDVHALWAHHLARRAQVTMTLIPNPAPERYGGVLLDEEGWVTGFCRRGDPRPSFHFFYAQVTDASVFARLPDGVVAESVLGIYPDLIASNPRAISGYVCDAPFIDVGAAGDYLNAHSTLARAEHHDPWAPGRGTRVAPDARVDRSILWDDVIVEAGAALSDCIVGDGVRVATGARYQRSVIVRADACGGAIAPGERIEGELLIATIPS